jgi:hypothetical protein
MAASAMVCLVSDQDLGTGLLLPSTNGLVSGVSGFIGAEAELKATTSRILRI